MSKQDVVELARKYVTAKRVFDKKWHQDNCPERGDFMRWYADRAKANTVLIAKFDALEAALAATPPSSDAGSPIEAWTDSARRMRARVRAARLAAIHAEGPADPEEGKL